MKTNEVNGIKPIERLTGNQWNWNETDPVKLKQMENEALFEQEIEREELYRQQELQMKDYYYGSEEYFEDELYYGSEEHYEDELYFGSEDDNGGVGASNSVVVVDEETAPKTESNQQENATPAKEESVKAEQEDTILSNNDVPTQVPAAPQKTISLDMQAVNDIFDGLRAKPTYALVRVKLMEGCLNIKARMWFGDNTDREYESPANYKLINLIIRAMDGNVIDIPYEFKQEENRWAYYNNDADPRVNVFDKFMQSSLKCHIEKDFIPEDGIRRACITFTISKGMEFKFCLERTDEIEKIINRRIGKA